MGLVQPEKRSFGEHISNLLVPIRKLSRRWSQALHRVERVRNNRD